jgi:hypothetical protein
MKQTRFGVKQVLDVQQELALCLLYIMRAVQNFPNLGERKHRHH